VGGAKAWVRFFWVGVRWLVLSRFGVLALVNIWGLLALARVGSSAIVEANMDGLEFAYSRLFPYGRIRRTNRAVLVDERALLLIRNVSAK
jgi:hypothetical protein